MIQVSDDVKQGWLVYPPRKASDADLLALEATFGARLPAQYADFVKHYGFVKFGYDANDTRVFTFVYEGEGQRELRQATAGFLVPPDRAVQTWTTFTDKSDPDSEESPLIPDGYFPAGNDNGQGLILIELATGKIWYWRESAWRWGTEDNTRLGFVADDFDGFINALRPETA
ncbi:MAG TPA: SMI1/KNR4 family protein [Burkholderiaceae bacterium]